MKLQRYLPSESWPVLAILLLSSLFVLSGCQPETKPSLTGSSLDPLENLVDSARWAQNAHNIQSWRLWWIDATTARGGLDPTRLLPKTDPYDRQLILSLGTFTEATSLSAQSQGNRLWVRWIAPDGWNPQQDPGLPVFEWKLVSGDSQPKEPATSGLNVDVFASPTVKYRVNPARLNAKFVGEISQFDRPGIKFTVVDQGPKLVKVLGLAREAYNIEMTQPGTLMESVTNTVYGAQARAEHPYGITLLGNFDKNQVGFVEFLAQIFPQSPSDYGRSGIDMLGKVLDRCQQVIVLTTSQNTPREQFEAGRALQQMWMAVLARGDVLLPLSQGLQEPHQYDSDREQLVSLLAGPGETVQMLLAVGKPDGEFLRAPRIPANLLFVGGGN